MLRILCAWRLGEDLQQAYNDSVNSQFHLDVSEFRILNTGNDYLLYDNGSEDSISSMWV